MSSSHRLDHANTGGSAINTDLDNDNNGRGLFADGCFYGGNA
jgi:hypothetical protein